MTEFTPDSQPARQALRQLRWGSWVEGSTLLLLVLVAVPLKRLAGLPEAVSIMGPIHGAAFVAYVLLVLWTLRHPPWRAGDTLPLLLAAFLPFGAWFLGGLFRRRLAEIGPAAPA